MLAGPARRLRLSLDRDHSLFPLQGGAFDDDVALLTIDAFLQRFQQVVDLTLRKLFPKLVAALELREERVALRPVLDRLEREGLIESADWWSELNELRNRLVHEYAMAPDQRAAELNKAWSYAHGLLEQLEAIRRHLERNDD
jgi:hypothetical protein